MSQVHFAVVLVAQDYNIRHYILRRTKTEFRKNATLTGDEAAAKVKEVSLHKALVRGLRVQPARRCCLCASFLIVDFSLAGTRDTARDRAAASYCSYVRV